MYGGRPFVILGVPDLFCRFYSIFMVNSVSLSANTIDPEQRPQYVASHLGLHCLPMHFYGFPGKNKLKYPILLTRYGSHCSKRLARYNRKTR